jgi:imidazolonepropionase-like amidohydrolase
LENFDIMKLVPNSLVFGLLFAIAIGSTFSESIAQQSKPPQTKSDVYFADQIWPGNGEPIENGAMVVVDGIITAIGSRDEISIPSVATRHDFGSQVLIPGLVLPQTSLGGNQTEERTITPQIRALDGFDFFADRDTLIESGITTVQVSPARVRLMPGVGGVVKLAGDDLTDRILQEEESLQIVLTSASRQPPRIYEPAVGPVSEDRPISTTRPQVATLSASMATLRQIFRAATAGETEGDEILEAVASIIESKKPVRIAASTAPEIRGAISLAKEFDAKIILTDCEGLETFKGVFADWKKAVAGVVLTANVPGSISNPSLEQIETQKEPWTFARELLDAGIPVAIAPRQATSLTSSMFVAGQFMRDGLNHTELLSALTHASASMMGIDDHVGSLSTGKHADFVVLSGKPFGMHSRVRATFVAGEPLFERTISTATTVVSAGRIYVGDGKYLDDGQVVVKGHTVRGVGANVSAPAEANIRQFKDAVIVPGFVDMGTGLGLGGPLSGSTTLASKLGEQLYADDPAIEYARKKGITTALLSGSGSSATPVVAFKLGEDARVIGDPVAIKFRLSGSTSAAIASAEKQLAAGKKYVDSWKKYEKDLAEYKEKLKAEAAKPKPKTEATKDEKKDDSKKADPKKEEDKKDPEKEKDKDKPKPEEKDPDKKEVDKDKDKKKKKPLPDPITGTWDGEIDAERIPPRFRAFQWELELADDGTVTGTMTLMGRDAEISTASYDRESRELTVTLERGGRELSFSGELDTDGEYEGSVEFGPMGEVTVTASRTVDKSKKPEPEEDEKDEEEEKEDKPEKKDPDKDEEKDKDEKKEKPAEGDKDKDKDKDKEEAEKKKAEAKDADKKDEKPAEKKETKKPTLKEPKRPKKVDTLEPYKALFAKEIPAFVETRELFTIKEAAKLFSQKYNVRTIMVGADALAREPDALADYSVSVIAGPKLSVAVPKQLEATNLPQLLANQRLPFAFQSSGTTGAGQLPGAIQYSISRGLSTNDALSGLTSAPAKMLSDKMTFGSIAAGNDADLVVLSGPPFEFSTKILAVMIDGVWVYELKEEK